MLNWLKKKLGLQPSYQETAQHIELPLSSPPADGAQTVEALDAENIELGYQAERLRQRRILNRKIAAALRDGSN